MPPWGMGIFNLLFLYQAFMMIVNGCRDLNLKLTATGCVLFAVITFTRYTDLFVSLLSRSMAFLIAGAALFAMDPLFGSYVNLLQRGYAVHDDWRGVHPSPRTAQSDRMGAGRAVCGGHLLF